MKIKLFVFVVDNDRPITFHYIGLAEVIDRYKVIINYTSVEGIIITVDGKPMSYEDLRVMDLLNS